MKLLFDQNLSFKLVNTLSDVYPDSRHVKMIGLEEADDREILELAKRENHLLYVFIGQLGLFVR